MREHGQPSFIQTVANFLDLFSRAKETNVKLNKWDQLNLKTASQ